jgi:lipopolysaccharide export system protein LptA
MACKFHAAMNLSHIPFLSPALRRAALLLGVLAALAPAVHAEKADRSQRMTIAADQPSTIDLLKQVVVFNGNVVITQGTLTIHADRVEVRESADGFHAATAIGSAGRPASFRQKRDSLDEYIEGEADRVEYDGRADKVLFIGHAQVRRLRGATPADEINGSQITYDNAAEVFSVQGGATSASPGNPGGRVRAVLTPPPEGSAGKAPTAAPPPAAAASEPPASLKPSNTLKGQQP